LFQRARDIERPFCDVLVDEMFAARAAPPL
jgi:hypothetical protein